MKNKIKICAPLINRWRPQSCHQGHSELDAKSKELLGKLFKELSRLETCGRYGDEIYNLWLCADRGPMEAFGDWEEYVAEGEVKDRAEFEAMWRDYYPNEKVWYCALNSLILRVWSIVCRECMDAVTRADPPAVVGLV